MYSMYTLTVLISRTNYNENHLLQNSAFSQEIK